MTQSVCRKLNEELGLGSGAPPSGEAAYVPSGSQAGVNPNYMNDQYGGVVPSGPPGEIIGNTDGDVLKGQPFGCYDAGSNVYVYYHVLVER